MSTLQTILAILPGIFICFWIFYRDRYEREPIFLLIICFIVGVLSTIPAIALERIGFDLGIQESENPVEVFILSFGVVAFSEELVKFIGVMIFAYPWKYFNEPMDGIVYSVMVSMGFATLENLLYSDLYGIDTIILRAFTAVPAHAAFGILMGYHIGRAKFKLGNRYWQLFLGLAAAVVFHGAYDFFLLQQNIPELSILAIVILVICIFYTRKLIQIHNDGSPFNEESEKLVIIEPNHNITENTEEIDIIEEDQIIEEKEIIEDTPFNKDQEDIPNKKSDTDSNYWDDQLFK